MPTNDEFTHLYNKKLLPLDDLKLRFFDYLLSTTRAAHADMFPEDRVIDQKITVAPASPSANHMVDVKSPSGTTKGVSGTGRSFRVGTADAELLAIKIPPGAGDLYHIGLEQVDIDVGTESNPRTGEPEFSRQKEVIGRKGNPSAVVDNGSTLTLTLSTILAAGDDHSGRTVLVYYKPSNGRPAVDSLSVAFETLTSAFGSGVNTVTTAAKFGQTVASTTASDYVVVVLGPTVVNTTDEDLTATPGCLFLAEITSVASGNVIPGGNIDTTYQNLFVPPAISFGDQIIRNHGFEDGVTGSTVRNAITEWDNYQAGNGNFLLRASGMSAGGKVLCFNKVANSAVVAIRQHLEHAVTPGQQIRVFAKVKQLIAPTAGNYYFSLNWGDADGATSGSTTDTFERIGVVDGAYVDYEQLFSVPANRRFLKSIEINVDGIDAATDGDALLVDELLVYCEQIDDVDNNIDRKLGRPVVAGLQLEDIATYALGQLAALLTFDKSAPTNEGKVVIGRRDGVVASAGANLPPALQMLGRMFDIGRYMLTNAASNALPRVGIPISDSLDFTNLIEVRPESLGLVTADLGYRLYATAYDGSGAPTDNQLAVVMNAKFDGTNWSKDTDNFAATMWQFRPEGVRMYWRPAPNNGTWTTAQWTPIHAMNGTVPVTASTGTSSAKPMLELFDSAGNRRSVFDHLGFPSGWTFKRRQDWLVGTAGDLDAGSGGAGGSGAPEGWSLLQSGSAGYQFNSTTFPGILLAVDNSAGVVTVETLHNLFSIDSLWPQDNAVHAMEWLFRSDAALTGATPGAVCEMGFCTSPNSVSVNRAMFKKVDGAANWKLFIEESGGSTDTYDLGVAASGLQRFRLEAYGTNAPGGKRILAFINGSLVKEVVAPIAGFPDNEMGFSCKVTRSTAGSAMNAGKIGPWVNNSRVFLSDDAL